MLFLRNEQDDFGYLENYEGIDDELNEKEFMECENEDRNLVYFSELFKRREKKLFFIRVSMQIFFRKMRLNYIKK